MNKTTLTIGTLVIAYIMFHPVIQQAKHFNDCVSHRVELKMRNVNITDYKSFAHAEAVRLCS